MRSESESCGRKLRLYIVLMILLTVWASAAKAQEEANHAAFNPQEFSQKYTAVEVIATGYSAGRESTGKDPGHPQYGITYSGVEVRRDIRSISTIAADLRVFPLGTVLYIPGYGYGIVADIGSAIKGHKIDLYFNSKADVYANWGKKKVKVYVIERGKGKITAEMMEHMTRTYKS